MRKLNILFLGMNGFFSLLPLQALNKYHNIIGIIEAAPRKYRQSFRFKAYYHTLKIYHWIFKRKDISVLKEFAKKKKLPYFFCSDINVVDMERTIKKLTPDLICIASFSQLLKPNIIEIPKYGVINMHPSYLPQYRGANPWFWMYYYMEKQGGITIHYVDKGEDTGDIIYQQKYEIYHGEAIESLQKKAIRIGTKLIVKAVNDIAENTVKPMKQEITGEIRKAPNVLNGQDYIDWENWSIEEIYHFLRGNYASVLIGIKHFWDKGKNLSILDYKKCKILKKYAIGSIYKEQDREWICCKDGKIYVKRTFDIHKLIKNLL